MCVHQCVVCMIYIYEINYDMYILKIVNEIYIFNLLSVIDNFFGRKI